MINLSDTDIGTSWIKQFSTDDQALAIGLIDSILLVSHKELFERLENLILERSESSDYPIGLYAERELEKIEENPCPLFKQPNRKKRRRACGLGPKPVDPLCQDAPEVGSEGLVSNLITNICEKHPQLFINHPGPDLIREKRIHQFFLVTDFIGSGNRALTYLQAAWQVASVKSWCSYNLMKFEVLAYSGTSDGVVRVKKHKCKPNVNLVTACPTIKSEFQDEKLERIYKLCVDYDPISKNSLGFGNVGALIAFSHRCPNNVPNIIYKSKNGKWTALFPSRVTSEVSAIFGDRNDCSSLRIRLEKLGDERLSTGAWIKETSPQGRKMLILLATLRKAPRFDEAISRKTRFVVPEIRLLVEKARLWGLVDKNRRLTEQGYQQLKKARLPNKEEIIPMDETSSVYYPKSLRVPFNASS